MAEREVEHFRDGLLDPDQHPAKVAGAEAVDVLVPTAHADGHRRGVGRRTCAAPVATASRSTAAHVTVPTVGQPKLHEARMNVTIEIVSSAADTASFDLQVLRDELLRHGLPSRPERSSATPGEKTLEPATALALANLVAGQIAFLWTIFVYYRSQRPKCTITINAGDVTYTVSDLPAPEVTKIAQQLATAERASVKIHQD